MQEVYINNEQPDTYYGYISNTGNPDNVYNPIELAEMLARKDAGRERAKQIWDEAEKQYLKDTALNIGGGKTYLLDVKKMEDLGFKIDKSTANKYFKQ